MPDTPLIHHDALHFPVAEHGRESAFTQSARNQAWGKEAGKETKAVGGDLEGSVAGLPQVILEQQGVSTKLNGLFKGINDKPAVTTSDGKVTKIVYPKNAGTIDISYDKAGVSVVTKNGKPMLERLSEPRANGDARWKILGNVETHGSFSVANDGSMKFRAESGDLYKFKPDGTQERLTPIQEQHAKEEALHRELQKISPLPLKQVSLVEPGGDDPKKFAEWVENNWSKFDRDKDGYISSREVAKAVGDKRLVRDSDKLLALIDGFEGFDHLGVPDNKLSKGEIAVLKRRADEPGIKEAFKIFDEAAKIELSKINQNLWGEFKNPKDAIKSDAISQGNIGDCWLMGSIAAVADRIPDKIEKMIKENGDGTFTVTFPGLKEKPVTIEAPTLAELYLYAKSRKYGTWVAVLEKAAAKAINDHLAKKQDVDIVALHGGDPAVALTLLTGDPAPRLDTSSKNFLDQLRLANEWELPIVAGSRRIGPDTKKDERGVYFTHLYTLTYDPKTNTVAVRNPWGAEAGSEPTNALGKPIDGVADGVFRLSLEDFKKSFPDVWTCVR